VQSSIIAGNINGDIGYKNNPSPFASLGYNLIGTGINSSLASFNQAGDQTGVLNPMLGALASNGGPTQTRLPMPGSPAIDAGNPAAVAGVGGVPVYDQRGNPYTRVWDGDGAGGTRIDIGAVEVQTLPLPHAVYGDYNSDGAVDGGDYVLARKTVGANVTPYADADGSGNGVVGAEDVTIWRGHYGETVAAGSGASIDVVSEVRAGVGPTLMFESLSAGPLGTAGQASSRTHIWASARAVASEILRDDALVAWAESKDPARGRGAVEFDVTGSDSIERFGDDSCDALDAAVGERMGAAL
jgi:hypothetical protein